MSFSLVATVESGADTTFLQISSGTRPSGADMMGGTFGATLDGMFDCESGAITGTLKDGSYTSPGAGDIPLAGALSGTYMKAVDGGAPEFTGALGPLSNPDWDALGLLAPNAVCTWSASLVAADAGM